MMTTLYNIVETVYQPGDTGTRPKVYVIDQPIYKARSAMMATRNKMVDFLYLIGGNLKDGYIFHDAGYGTTWVYDIVVAGHLPEKSLRNAAAEMLSDLGRRPRIQTYNRDWTRDYCMSLAKMVEAYPRDQWAGATRWIPTMLYTQYFPQNKAPVKYREFQGWLKTRLGMV